MGVVHAVLRTALVTAMWWMIPECRITGVAAAVVAAYLYSIIVLAATQSAAISRVHRG